MWGTPTVDMFATLHNLASSPVYVKSSRASSTGDRCSITRLAGEVDVHVSTVPPAQQRPTVTTEICLKQQVVPFACMEALMQQYQAAGFSKEVSRFAAALRRPSTNRMYDDRWLRFANWGYRLRI